MKGEHKNERPSPVPEWLLERLATGELPPEREAEVRRRLALEPGGAERLAALTRSNEEILAAHPPAAMLKQIAERAHLTARLEAARPKPRGRGWLFAFAPPVLAMGTLGLMMALRAPHKNDGGNAAASRGPEAASFDDEGIIIKGSPRLRVYRKVGDRSQRLQADTVAHAGDRLQLAYVAGGKRFGAVASVDGAGKVTFHLPADAGPAVQLRTDGEITLATSYELDAAPGFEKFLFVTSDAPFDASVLTDMASGKVPAPAGASTTTFTVRKE
jgi:hypothetical protein